MRSRGGGLSLAFLDLLSCSLGAMILLFLIFSALEHQGDRNSRSTDGLPLEGEFRIATKQPGEDEPKAPMLFEVSVDIEDDSKRVKIRLEAVAGSDGVEVSEVVTIADVADDAPRRFYVWVKNPLSQQDLLLSPSDFEVNVQIQWLNSTEAATPAWHRVKIPATNHPIIRFASGVLSIEKKAVVAAGGR